MVGWVFSKWLTESLKFNMNFLNRSEMPKTNIINILNIKTQVQRLEKFV